MADYEFGHCRLEDLYDLVDLANRVFRAGGDGDMGREYPLVFEAQNTENLRVARYGDQVIGHVGISLRDASILGARVRVASIGAVATDPEHRGKGIASRLMADARAHAIERGASLMLISGGRGLYHRLGYVTVGAFQCYLVPAGEPHPEFEVRPFEQDDLAALITLHQAEPVRFFRDRIDWERLLAAGRLMNQPADLLVIRHANAIVAYAGVQHPNPRRQPATGPTVVRVREIAGSRSALATALPVIAQRYGMEVAEVVVDPTDAEWRSQAVGRGWDWTLIPFPGTLGIIEPARFLRAVHVLVEERAGHALSLEPEREGARISLDSDGVTLATRGQLTALVFGGDTPEATDLPEISLSLRTAVGAAFPLPLLWYGYNYV